MKTNRNASRVPPTASTTRCRGAFDLTRTCSRHRAREITKATPRSIGGDVLAFPINRTWESLEDEFPGDASVCIECEPDKLNTAHLMLFFAARTANLRGRFRLLDTDVLVVEGDLITPEDKRIHIDGPPV